MVIRGGDKCVGLREAQRHRRQVSAVVIWRTNHPVLPSRSKEPDRPACDRRPRPVFGPDPRVAGPVTHRNPPVGEGCGEPRLQVFNRVRIVEAILLDLLEDLLEPRREFDLPSAPISPTLEAAAPRRGEARPTRRDMRRPSGSYAFRAMTNGPGSVTMQPSTLVERRSSGLLRLAAPAMLGTVSARRSARLSQSADAAPTVATGTRGSATAVIDQISDR